MTGTSCRQCSAQRITAIEAMLRIINPVKKGYALRLPRPLPKHLRDEEEVKFFEAMLTMQRQEISSNALAWVLVRFPAMTIKVLAMIYWQAFRLWLKKTPYYEHPKYLQKRKA